MSDRALGNLQLSYPLVLNAMPADSDFVANKCSLRSRKIVVIDHSLTIELWFNQHYYERFWFGDDKGKREGIEPELIESLVTRAMAHLFWYSTVVSGFSFINYQIDARHIKRIVVQEVVNGSKLNVVIEVHYLSLHQFEISVVTAMVVDNFKVYSGQFCIEMQQANSVLRRIDDGKVLDLCCFRFA